MTHWHQNVIEKDRLDEKIKKKDEANSAHNFTYSWMASKYCKAGNFELKSGSFPDRDHEGRISQTVVQVRSPGFPCIRRIGMNEAFGFLVNMGVDLCTSCETFYNNCAFL